jgi:alkyl hydroperoxide reductase subunit AhpC
VAGISVDPPAQNAAMVAKLRLPFPLLSDPDGTAAIKPYDVWNDQASIALPALVLVGPDGDDVWRQVSRDFADRATEEEVLARVQGQGWPAVSQEAPAPGDAQPGERAMPVEKLVPYFRGATFAAKALAGRVPDAKAEADALVAEYDRYQQAVKTLR